MAKASHVEAPKATATALVLVADLAALHNLAQIFMTTNPGKARML
jgi:hypothetical protein